MKKLLALVLAGVMAFSLVACGGGSDKETKAAENKKTVSKTDKKAPVVETEDENVDVEQMMAESRENILKHADESIQSQVLNRERILQLL